MSDIPLYMVRAEFDELAVMRFAHATGLGRIDDGGYVMHAVLRALFGRPAPRPFAVRAARSQRMMLLSYSVASHQALADDARALADPLALAVLDCDSFCSKPMPTTWRIGAQYRFEARVCPIVRVSGRRNGEQSRELDVFLHRCSQVDRGMSVDREAVYREWLAHELGRDGAAQMRQARVVRFQRQRLARRDRSARDARLRRCERSDVTLAGVLEVTSSDAFSALLRRGLGRHRSFGFGMLLLSH